MSQRRLHYARAQTMHLRTVVGVVALRVWYGLNPATRHWGCPTRQHWGLSAYQQFWTDPGLRCLTALMEARINGHGDQLWSPN